MSNPIVWADIPATDLQRAMKFYGHVTGRKVLAMPGADDIAVFEPSEERMDSVSADLYLGGTPSHTGATIYLGGEGDMDGMLERVIEAGGRILEGKVFRGDMVGWIAFFEDSEGNRIGIQQPPEGA
jgi:predicted enzyme related to lactoylglutathione lyase